MPFQSQQVLKASQLNELEASIAAVDTYARSISAGAKGEKGDPGPPGATTIAGITGLQSELDGKLAVLSRGVANGVAPLGADGKVPSANLPASSGSGGGVTLPISIADVTNLSTQLNARVPTSNVGIPGGIAPLGVDGKVPAANLPASATSSGGITADYLTPVIELTDTLATRQDRIHNKIVIYKGTTTINVTLEARDVGTVARFIQTNSGQISFFATGGGNRQTSTGVAYVQPAQKILSFSDSTISAGKGAAVMAVLVTSDTWHLSGALV